LKKYFKQHTLFAGIKKHKLKQHTMKKLFSLFISAAIFLLQVNAQNVFPVPNGNVGIGDNTAGAKLSIGSTSAEPQVRVFQGDANDFARIRMVNRAGLNINGPQTNGRYWDIAAFIDRGQFEGLDQLSFWNQRTGNILNLRGNGNVGIKNGNPTAPLSFATELGKKISLYHGNTGDVGFSVQGNSLQIHIDDANGEVALGFDNNTTGFNERFAVKRTGALAIAKSTGNPGQVLTSAGSGAAPVWATPATAASPANQITIQSTNRPLFFTPVTDAVAKSVATFQVSVSKVSTALVSANINYRSLDIATNSNIETFCKVDGQTVYTTNDCLVASFNTTVAIANHAVTLQAGPHIIELFTKRNNIPRLVFISGEYNIFGLSATVVTVAN
jgi:hypothetical protein